MLQNTRRRVLVAGVLAAAGLTRSDEVGIIEGVATDLNAQQRSEGLRSAMNAAGMKIVAVAPGDWVYSKGKAAGS